MWSCRESNPSPNKLSTRLQRTLNFQLSLPNIIDKTTIGQINIIITNANMADIVLCKGFNIFAVASVSLTMFIVDNKATTKPIITYTSNTMKYENFYSFFFIFIFPSFILTFILSMSSCFCFILSFNIDLNLSDLSLSSLTGSLLTS